MAKRKNQGGPKETGIGVAAIIVISALIYFLAFAGKTGEITTPGVDVSTPTDTTDLSGANVGSDIPAYVQNDECVSREGVDMGLCCATWDTVAKEEKWVLCDTLVQKQDPLQAFFTFENGQTLEAVSSVMFAVRLSNTGNAPADVKLSNVEVTALSGGDAASINEIQNGFGSLLGSYRTVQPGAFTDFNMQIANRIRLDIPQGTSAFTMADGTYQVKVFIQVKDENGIVSDGGSRIIQMVVEQENIAFSIDVTATA